MRQEYIEKIAFCFSSSPIEVAGDKLSIPTIVWVIQDDIDYTSGIFKIWLSIGFIGLLKKTRYIVKVNIYKEGVKLLTTPTLDAGIIIEPDNKLSHDGRVAAAMTEDVSILEKPENGLYKAEVSLHTHDNKELAIDTLSTYFEIHLTSSLLDQK